MHWPWRVALTVLLATFCGSILGYEPTDCGSKSGKWTRFKIKECEETSATCALERDFNVTIVIDFTPSRNVTSVFVVVRAVIMHINIRLKMRLRFACLFGNIECPLKANQLYNYEQKWNTWRVPKYEMLLRWNLEDEVGRNIICVQVPAIFA